MAVLLARDNVLQNPLENHVNVNIPFNSSSKDRDAQELSAHAIPLRAHAAVYEPQRPHGIVIVVHLLFNGHWLVGFVRSCRKMGSSYV